MFNTLRNDHNLFIIALIFAIFLISIIMFGRWLNYRVLFQPKPDMIWKPTKGTYKDIYIRMDDLSGKPFTKSQCIRESDYINVWHFTPFENERVVLYCHGNNDNNSYRDYIIDICKRFHLNLLLVDYRGYGNSDGRPTSEGVVIDAKCAYGYLRRTYEHDQIIVWGESLGGSAAIRVAAEYPCHKLILLATFASLPDIFANSKMNKFAKNSLATMVDFMWDNINSKYWISKIKCPIAIIHSKDDELIPYPNSKILYNSISHNEKKFISVKGSHGKPTLTKDNLISIFTFAHDNSDLDFKPNSNDLEGIIKNIKGHD